MIRIKKFNNKKIAKNNFSLLKERSMAAINSFDVENYFEPEDDIEILDHFELLYELEYKYHQIQNNNFLGLEKRRENILNIIETKSKQLIPAIADTFETVFSYWLDNHALTDPQKWAKQRFYENGESIIEIFGLDYTWDLFIGELNRYTNMDKEDIILKAININPKIMEESLLDLFVEDKLNLMIEDLKYSGIEEFNNIYEDFLNIKFKTEEEARDFIEDQFNSLDSFMNLFSTKEGALEYIIENLSNMGALDEEDSFIQNYIDWEEFFLIAYEHILFPFWYDYWSSMGIEETRDNVEEVYNQIVNIKKYPLQKQFMILNIAKNTNHQNGSMMEYYEEIWNVDYVALKKLSDMDTREWDEELKEIGVDL